MTGYVRVDTSNNIADGNVINSADLDNEFDGVQAAFNSSTGHVHDGTSGNGAPITKIGPVQDVVVGTTTMYPKTTNTVDLGTSSLKYKDLYLAGNASVAGTLGVTGVVTFTAQPILSSLTASRAVFSDGSKGLVSNAITGTGDVVMSNSPTLVTPTLGTPASATLTNATGLPIGTGVSGLGTGIATALAVNVGTAGAPVVNGGALGTPSSGTVTNLTGTASININGTVGATTANTGAFTTLTTSSTVTHNGGTANGVAYLNGSKELTTGSALTFDGSSLVGTGKFQPQVLRIKDASYSELYFSTGDTGGNGAISYNHSLNAMAFYANGSEQMRLTSTGLGIGTSSPATGVHLQRSSGNTYYRAQNNLTSVDAGVDGGGTGILWNNGNYPLAFGTNNTERMRLDSAGNLGLGVTPSAWSRRVFQIAATSGDAAYLANSSGTLVVANNVRYNSGDFYINSSYATYYAQQTNGAHVWANAPSGTAGNAISFTQVLTVAADGKATSTAVGVDNNFTLNSTAGAYSTTLTLAAAGGGGSTINATGASSDYLRFTITGTERARIDSNGNLLVGTTSAPNGTFLSKSNFIGLQTTNPADSTKWRQIVFANNSGDATLYFPNGTNTPTLSSAGTWTNASDARQKTNIVEIKYGLTTVLSAQPRSYNRTDVDGDFIGFVAQELKEQIPEVVFGSDETSYSVDYGSLVAVAFKAIQEQQALINAQQAALQTLTARVASLESN